MLKTDFQECPRCGGMIPREDFAESRVFDRVDKFVYCDFCGIGYEASFYDDGSVFALDYRAATEPIALGKFLQRLVDARVA